MSVGSAILGFFSIVWRGLDAVRKVLHLIFLLILFLFILGLFSSPVPIIPASGALLLNPHGRIVEQFTGDPLDRAIGKATDSAEAETRLRDIVDVIEAAARDKRIKVMVLDPSEITGGGLSKLQEIGQALTGFRKSGKKIVAMADFYDQGQYYLAAHADEIYLDPFGIVFVDGFEYFRMYFKEALDKLAVEVNVFKVGKYKSFTESYTRSDMSPEEREESLAWLKVLWSAYQQDVQKVRGLPDGTVAKYANEAATLVKGANGDAARVALNQGLVTGLKPRAKVDEELQEVVGVDDDTHSYVAVDFEDYLKVVRSEEVLRGDSSNKVGVIVAAGEILDGQQPPGTIGGDSLSAVIRDARFDDEVKAVVLRIDTPGGSMFASEQIYREVQALRAAGKPVIVSMSSTAASGGYYIAAAADEIWASPTTITGSIGVFAAIPTFRGTLDKIGVNVDGVGTTELSGEFRLDRGLGPDARQILQAGVEHAYQEFLARVAQRKGEDVEISLEEVDAIAQGRVWAAPDAHRVGLVDQIGDLEGAVRAAAKRAKLGDRYRVRYFDPEMSWQQLLALELRARARALARNIGFTVERPALLRKMLTPIERELRRWSRFNDPKNLYFYCFCEEGSWK
jgi:protease-4